MIGAEILEIAIRHMKIVEISVLPAIVINIVGVAGLAIPRIFGVVSQLDPTFIVMVVIGLLSAAGNAWIEFQWKRRRREEDARFYAKQKKIDIALYEMRMEKESGFDLPAVNTPDPDQECHQPPKS